MFEKLGLKSAVLVGAFSAVACGGGVCGDNVVDAENDAGDAEVCDDGNVANGDGCNAVCLTIESGFTCPAAGGPCVPNCGNGTLDAGEECDGALFAVGCEEFLATGTPTCQADCSATGDSCVSVAGDGIRSSDLITPGQGEECDDGNLADGDGCSAAMTLEALSTVTLTDAAGDAVELLNTVPDAAVFSVFSPMVGVFDGGNQSLLFVISTDDPAICDVILASGGFNGFLDNLFGAGANQVIGTVVLTMISQNAAAGNFTAQTFTGVNEVLANAGTIGTSAGYTVIDNNAAIISDTTFGSDGLGVINLTAINTVDIDTGLVDANGDPVLRAAGNLELDYTDINQITQFIPAETVISALINGNITAASCSLDIF
jgi:cysteine-rich repeat protein